MGNKRFLLLIVYQIIAIIEIDCFSFPCLLLICGGGGGSGREGEGKGLVVATSYRIR